MKDHVCPIEGCMKSFHTEKGVEHHKRRGNHDPGAKDTETEDN